MLRRFLNGHNEPRPLAIRTYLVLLVLAAMLPLIAFGAFMLWWSLDLQRATAQRGIRDTAHALSLATDREVQRVQDVLETLAASPRLDVHDFKTFYELSSRAAQERKGSWIVLFDRAGQQIINTRRRFGAPLPNTLREADERPGATAKVLPLGSAWTVKKVLDGGEAVVSDVFLGIVSKQSTLSVAVPVTRGGKVLYAVEMAFSPEHLTALLHEQALPADWIASTLDRQGIIIARTLDPGRFVGRPATPAHTPSAPAANEGWGARRTFEGVAVEYAFTRSKRTGWTTDVAVPRTALSAPWHRSVAIMAAGIAVVVLFACLVALILARKIASPISALADAAEALHRGASIDVKASRVSELNVLQSALQQAGAAQHKTAQEREQRIAAEARQSQAEAANRRLLANLATTEILAESPRLRDAAPRILKTIGESLGWEVGVFWIADSAAKKLRCLDIWHNPSATSPALAEFVAASKQHLFTSGVGLAGRIWKTLSPAWIRDVARDDNFPRAPFALAAGLHAGFGFPIVGAERFHGAIEFFNHEILEPDDALLAMFAVIGGQMGQYIERRRAQKAQAEQARLLDLCADAIIVRDTEGRITYWNQGAEEMYGYTREEVRGNILYEVLKTEFSEPLEQITQCLHRESRWSGELTHTSRNGSKIIVMSRWSLGRDEAGRPASILETNGDITLPKRTELALRASEARFAGVINSAMDAVIAVDQNQRMILFNHAAEEMFGYTSAQALGQPVDRIIPARFREAHRQHVETFGSTGVSSRRMGALGALNGLRANGEEFPIEASISQTEVGDQKIFTVIIRDITERKSAELKLLREKERLTLALTNGAMGVYEYDPIERVCWWSPECYEIHGVSPDTFDPMDGGKLVHPEDFDKVLDIPRAIEEHRPWAQEYRIIRPGGEMRWVAGRAQTEYDKDGKGRRFYGVLMDITERKRVEDAIKETEGRFRVMADSSPIMIWVVDTEGHVQFINRAYQEFFGVTLDDVLGPNWQPLVHPEDAPEYVSSFLESLKSRKTWSGRARLRRADGQWRWVESQSNPRFSDSGEFLGVVGSSPDITEQIEREQALREADRHKDEFLATLGHELRNPLNVINTVVQLLQMEEPLQPNIEQYRETLEVEAKQMSRLLDDLLDISRIGQGLIRLETARCDLAGIVRRVVENHRPLLEEAGLTLTAQLPDQPMCIIGDETRLAQIVRNLLYNATKFTERDGRVAVQLSAEGDGKLALLTVQDTGIGIKPENLGRIFDPFVQGENGLDRSRGGLGLGLALVKALVSLHRGEVWATSAGPGHGSKFSVRLPVSPEPCVLQPKDTPPLAVRLRRVLIIEDDVMAARNLQTFLTKVGHTVEVALSGRGGIEAAQDFAPEFVLCDIGLPELDGYAVGRALRQIPKLHDTYLIAVSGYGQERDQRRALEVGFNKHLTKPLNLSELASLIGGCESGEKNGTAPTAD